jgi:hypothetical protein
MATSAQIYANRLNAQKSTGPKTPEGRAKASQGNFRHGLRGEFKMLSNEDPEEFHAFLESLREEHSPSTPTEEVLVQQMAEHFWLTRRARGFQDTMLLNPETFTIKMMNMWMRYETQHQRAFHKCLADLLKLRAEQRKERKEEAKLAQQPKNGFEWKKPEQEPQQPNQRVATAQSEPIEITNPSRTNARGHFGDGGL